MTIATFALALGLALVHLFVGRLTFLRAIPRSRWLSFGSGVSVAYVFVHLLPELAEAQRRLSAHGALDFLETHAYLLALAGLVVFYGLERLSAPAGKDEEHPPMAVFRLHVASFAVYNALIGYLLLHREESGVRSLMFYWIAMALHFVVNDYGLRQRHGEAYRRRARWALAASVAGGWFVGLWFDVTEATLAALLALLAGGVILNVLKEELPEERESRFSAFLVGAASYAVVLLAA